MKRLNYLMDILSIINFKIVKITFKLKTVFYLELLNPEAIKLFESTKIRWTKIKMVKMCLI